MSLSNSEICRIINNHTNSNLSHLDNNLRSLLVITPVLSLNGANVVLKELLELITPSMNVYVLSAQDGIYREEFEKIGACVFIKPQVQASGEFKAILQFGFDSVLLNTASCNYYLYYYINIDTPVLWWFHETKEHISLQNPDLVHLAMLSPNIRIAGVTNIVLQGLKELYNVQATLLHIPVKEVSLPAPEPQDRVIFFMPAAYTNIKGQDLLCRAIANLPDIYINKSFFIFCGYKLPGQVEYYDALKKFAESVPSIAFLDELPRNEVYDLYNMADCVLAPSRLDTNPASIVEGLMFKKICVVSDAAGISKHLTNQKNALIFPKDDYEALQHIIMDIIDNKEKYRDLANSGYLAYKSMFSPDAVRKTICTFPEFDL